MAHPYLRRRLITSLPFAGHAASLAAPPWEAVPEWPARWLAFPAGTAFALYRLTLSLPGPLRARVHMTADERYEVYVDGALAVRGSERGDAAHWFFETCDLRLPAGRHTLVARVWALGGGAPWAQVRIRPGFLLAAEGAAHAVLTTGHAPWQVSCVPGLRTADGSRDAGTALGGGAGFVLECAQLQPGWERGRGTGWATAEPGELPATTQSTFVRPDRHYLAPATLPPQRSQPWTRAAIRYAACEDLFVDPFRPVDASRSDPGLQRRLGQALSAGACRVAPRTALRAIIDLGDYVCHYPALVVAGGKGSTVRLRYAESLWLTADRRAQGPRDTIHGRVFRGLADEIRPDGRRHRIAMPWWRAGRYVQLEVRTGGEALELAGLGFEETRYEFPGKFRLETNIPNVGPVAAVALRTLRMCSHETHMDCPYYEQLQYIGDTRLQVLLSFLVTPDVRLARKALVLMDASRQNVSGLPLDAAPGAGKLIPPFALLWIAMMRDYMVWRGEAAFIRPLLPGAREVMERFLGLCDADGVFVSGRGWNYVDANEGFTFGVPPGGQAGGRSGVLQLLLVYSLMQLADLERRAGRRALAAHWRASADVLWRAARTHYWDPARQLFADDPGHTRYSQHAQVLAALSGLLPRRRARQLMERAMAERDLTRCSLYFSHYRFEAMGCFDGGRHLRERMDDWHSLVEQGFKTFPEHFGPTRSECHAWSAHVLYHVLRTLVGIGPVPGRPDRIRIRPHLRRGEWVRASIPLAAGTLDVDLRMGTRVEGTLVLPAGVEAVALPAGIRRKRVR